MTTTTSDPRIISCRCGQQWSRERLARIFGVREIPSNAVMNSCPSCGGPGIAGEHEVSSAKVHADSASEPKRRREKTANGLTSSPSVSAASSPSPPKPKFKAEPVRDIDGEDALAAIVTLFAVNMRENAKDGSHRSLFEILFSPNSRVVSGLIDGNLADEITDQILKDHRRDRPRRRSRRGFTKPPKP